MKQVFIAAVALTLGCSAARAQSTFGSYVGSGQFYEPGTYTTGPVGSGAALPSDYIITGRVGVSPLGGFAQRDAMYLYGALPLSSFASSADVNSLRDQITGSEQRTFVALNAIAQKLDRLSSRFSEGVALAGSINVLPPNAGDRFAISFGGAGYNGQGAGSVAVSARIGDSGLAYVGYAQGASQAMVKGGVGWSFR